MSSWLRTATLGVLCLLTLAGCATTATGAGTRIVHHAVQDIDGEQVDLTQYDGEVLMIVNVASKCGFTSQYEQLEAIYRKYQDEGFVILGFPSNDFMRQEPGTNEEIKSFCTLTYGVTFPMFAKIAVKGKEMPPLYQDLTSKERNGALGGSIKWNFTKFLVGRDGHARARFGPAIEPDAPEVVAAIEAALAEGSS